MTLLNLADELLLAVAGNITHENDINALAQTSRRFYSLLNLVLYRYAVKRRNYSVLHWATFHGLSSIICMLLAEGASVRAATTRSKQTALHLASAAGICANVNAQTSTGTTPLHGAVSGGFEDVTQALLENGADYMKTLPDENRLTVLHISLEALLSKPNSDRCLAALAKLLNKPWWQRVWIVQEISPARGATMHCGTKYCPWTDFQTLGGFLVIADVYTTLATNVPKTRIGDLAMALLRVSMRHPNMIEGVQEAQSDTEAITLSVILERTTTYHATDPRDEVFNLLGLLRKSYPIVPNYYMSISQVYTTAFRAILQEEGDLRSFCWMLGEEEVKADSLPSWVPNFQAMSVTRKCLCISTSKKYIGPRYHASSPPTHASKPKATINFDDTTLTLFGRRFSVAAMGGFMGLAPPVARVGDVVVVLVGAEVPLLLRGVGGGFYEVIGQC